MESNLKFSEYLAIRARVESLEPKHQYNVYRLFAIQNAIEKHRLTKAMTDDEASELRDLMMPMELLPSLTIFNNMKLKLSKIENKVDNRMRVLNDYCRGRRDSSSSFSAKTAWALLRAASSTVKSIGSSEAGDTFNRAFKSVPTITDDYVNKLKEDAKRAEHDKFMAETFGRTGVRKRRGAIYGEKKRSKSDAQKKESNDESPCDKKHKRIRAWTTGDVNPRFSYLAGATLFKPLKGSKLPKDVCKDSVNQEARGEQGSLSVKDIVARFNQGI